jgi:shikimate 5-dehydrogenase/shikimate kinase
MVERVYIPALHLANRSETKPQNLLPLRPSWYLCDMLNLIIGHRGVGKTQFLSRVARYYGDQGLPVLTHDLDAEVEARAGRSLSDIFAKEGEDFFRELESQTLDDLVQKHRDFDGVHFIALGAGFKGPIPRFAKVLWLRRRTDSAGRIFLDRPRLEADLSPLDEYKSRYLARVARYRQWHHQQIFIEEGWDFQNHMEPVLLGLKPDDVAMSMTVLPEVMADEVRLEEFITSKTQVGVRYFEVRDDLLTTAQMDRLFSEIPRQSLLFSFRTKDSAATAKDAWWFNCLYDWALELGPCPWGVPKILSCHFRDPHEGLRECMERLTSQKAEHYKLAVQIENLLELWIGHQWWVEDPEHRSFLPMSNDGRWWWYRALQGRRMKINFLSDGEGSSFDQPTLFQQLMVNEAGPAPAEFAAVIGDPIQHSRSPAEQHDFFRALNMPFVSIQLDMEDCNEVGLSILHRLGLRAAAVTAPFKERMASLCDRLVGDAKNLKSVNTIVRFENSGQPSDDGWLGANTDVLALEKILSNMVLPERVFVWGGGGTRSTLMRLLPKAKFFRARTGEDFFGDLVTALPDVLIWAVGRSRQAHALWPDPSWRPLLVFDLNYAEDSPGREYALKVGARYISGLEMFRLQAQYQREFWLSSRNATAGLEVDA